MDFVRGALNATTRRLNATPGERASVRAYQHLEEHAERVRARALGYGDPREHLWALGEDLDRLLARSVLPVDVVTYRGIGDADEELPFDAGLDRTSTYLSTTLDRRVAEREFAVGPRPAVLRIGVHRGTHALWVPPLGWRELANEQELLFPRDTLVRYGARRHEGPLLVVTCEVIPW